MTLALDRLVVASHNPDKIAEIEGVLATLPHPPHIERGHSWPDVEETETTLAGNALLKARAVLAATGITALADDTGLEVAALDGAPGVRTARFAGEDATYADNVTLLLERLSGAVDRSARFRTAVALVTATGEERVFEGALDGEIANEPRGVGGFGYDPVFAVGGVTLAEMESSHKNRISHRARAIAALVAALRDG